MGRKEQIQPSGWTGVARERSAARVAERVALHDGLVLPDIRRLAADGWSWSRIADYLGLSHEAPAGGFGWTGKAVSRIAARHGIVRGPAAPAAWERMVSNAGDGQGVRLTADEVVAVVEWVVQRRLPGMAS